MAEIAREYSDNSMSICLCESHLQDGTRYANRIVDQQWPELLGVLFQLSQSGEPGQRENAYRIFATTPGIIEKQHEDTVLSAFTKGFKDDDVNVGGFKEVLQRMLISYEGPLVRNGGFCFILQNYQ